MNSIQLDKNYLLQRMRNKNNKINLEIQSNKQKQRENN